MENLLRCILVAKKRMNCQESIVSLIDELLRVFEMYRVAKSTHALLIKARHTAASYPSDKLAAECIDFYQQNKTAIDNGEITVFNKTPFGTLINAVWSELSSVDRSRVQEWTSYIVSEYLVR